MKVPPNARRQVQQPAGNPADEKQDGQGRQGQCKYPRIELQGQGSARNGPEDHRRYGEIIDQPIGRPHECLRQKAPLPSDAADGH